MLQAFPPGLMGERRVQLVGIDLLQWSFWVVENNRLKRGEKGLGLVFSFLVACQTSELELSGMNNAPRRVTPRGAFFSNAAD